MQELTSEEIVERIHVLTMDSKISRKLATDIIGLEIIAKIVLNHQNINVSYDPSKQKFIMSNHESTR